MILDPDISSPDQDKFIEKIGKMLAGFKGDLGKPKRLGLMALAYPIKKKSSGFFWRGTVKLPEDKLKEIDAKLRTEEAILRYLLVRIERKKAGKKKKGEHGSKVTK